MAGALTVLHEPCTLSKNKWSRGNVQHCIYKAIGRTSYFPHKDGPAWLMRIRRHNKSLIEQDTLFPIHDLRWGLLFSWGAGELFCPSPKMKRSRRDCFQTWSGHVCLPSWFKHNRSTIDFCQQEITLLRMCGLWKP